MQKEELDRSYMFCNIFCNDEAFLCVCNRLILRKKIFFLLNLLEMNWAPFIKKDLNIQTNAWLIFCLSPLPVTSY